jgi:hypothetical protein
MSNWHKIKEHGGIIAIVGALVALIGMNRSDTNMLIARIDRISDKIEQVMVRVENHECHISYLMDGRKPIIAPKE